MLTLHENRQYDGRNQKLMAGLLVMVFAMVGLSYASVPLYDLFCRVTGFGGTTQRAGVDSIPNHDVNFVSDRMVQVRFDTNIAQDLKWQFLPPEQPINLTLGEAGKVAFSAKNLTDAPLTGVATFNVTPQKAGIYFMKTQCFCFDEQRIEPHQTLEMPVYFYVDPALDEDKQMDDIGTITLSYSFFKAEE